MAMGRTFEFTLGVAIRQEDEDDSYLDSEWANPKVEQGLV